MLRKLILLTKYEKLKFKKAMKVSYEWWNWKTLQIGPLVFFFDGFRYVDVMKIDDPFVIGTPQKVDALLIYNSKTKKIEKQG